MTTHAHLPPNPASHCAADESGQPILIIREERRWGHVDVALDTQHGQVATFWSTGRSLAEAEADAALFIACMTGPDSADPPQPCTPEDFAASDFDGDGDADLDDVALMLLAFTGD